MIGFKKKTVHLKWKRKHQITKEKKKGKIMEQKKAKENNSGAAQKAKRFFHLWQDLPSSILSSVKLESLNLFP